MDTRRSAEIADGIYRLSTWVPDVAPPAGFTFNQFLIVDDEPLMFHTGTRRLFPLVRGRARRRRAPALDHLRPRRSRRVRRDERMAGGGTARRRRARPIGCMVSLRRPRDRPPRAWRTAR